MSGVQLCQALSPSRELGTLTSPQCLVAYLDAEGTLIEFMEVFATRSDRVMIRRSCVTNSSAVSIGSVLWKVVSPDRHEAIAGHELHTKDPPLDACCLDRRRTAGRSWSLPCESVRPRPWRPIISGRNLNQSVSLNDVPAAESCHCCQFHRRSRR